MAFAAAAAPRRALSADLGAAVAIGFEPSGPVCRIEAAPAGRAA